MSSYISIALFAAGIALGMYLEHEFNLASQTAAAYAQLVSAQQGEANIIKNTQVLTKDIRNDKKDPCLGATVPPDINKQLR